MNNKLAINGGPPLAKYEEWPKWPPYKSSFLESIKKVFGSYRWTISGFYNGDITFDERFCEAFSKYNGTKYALTVDHGSTAIILAMQALGVSYGDEVILPGLTWVACASAILRVNARPVFVDVEASNLCIDPSKVEEAITPKTRAILVVHLYCSMANMDALKKISHQYNIPIIEDCSQAHGAKWNGKKAGSIGDIGIFSMQQGKPLTCGEGGAIITNDNYLYKRMILLKNDGRSFYSSVPLGYQQLKEENYIIGSNFALSEFQCAILYENLKILDEILNLQRKNANLLYKMLSKIPGISFLETCNNTLPTYYHFIVLCDTAAFSNTTADIISKAISAELGFWVHQIYQPLYRHSLFQVQNDSRFSYLNLDNFNRIYLENCEIQSSKGIAIHHSLLLSSLDLLEIIAEAFQKVQKYSGELKT